MNNGALAGLDGQLPGFGCDPSLDGFKLIEASKDQPTQRRNDDLNF